MSRALPLWILLPFLLSGPLAADQAMTPVVGVSAADCDERDPVAASSPTHAEHLVVWWENCPSEIPSARIWARRFDHYGRPLGDVFPVGPSDDLRNRIGPAVAYDPVADRYLVVYSYDPGVGGASYDIRGRFLRRDGVDPAWSEFPVAQSAQLEVGPEVAYSVVSERFLVAFSRENSSARFEVWGALFGFGAVPVPFPITPPELDHRLAPSVSYDFVWNRFLVAYDNAFDVFSRGVDAETGAIGVEATLSTAPEDERSAAVASCGNDQHLVTWFRAMSQTNHDVEGRFLLGSGAIDGGVIPVAASPASEDAADLDCMPKGGDYLVVDIEELAVGGWRLGGRRIAPSKDLRPAFPVVGPGPGETLNLFSQDVSAGRAGWLVVWEAERLGSAQTYHDIFARKIWDLFADGFEWGGLDAWADAVP